MDTQRAALSLIRRLIESADPDAENYASVLAALAVAQLAATNPHVSVGVCAQDGTALAFVGRVTGLFLCCGGSPQHCYQIK